MKTAEILAFPFARLNNYMKNTKPKEHMQPHQRKATNTVNYWIKDHGMQASTFFKKPLLEVQALMQAHEMLSFKDGTVTADEIEMLEAFQARSAVTKRGHHQTELQCFRVFNLYKKAKGRINKRLALIQKMRNDLRKKQTVQ